MIICMQHKYEFSIIYYYHSGRRYTYRDMWSDHQRSSNVFSCLTMPLHASLRVNAQRAPENAWILKYFCGAPIVQICSDHQHIYFKKKVNKIESCFPHIRSSIRHDAIKLTTFQQMSIRIWCGPCKENQSNCASCKLSPELGSLSIFLS